MDMLLKPIYQALELFQTEKSQQLPLKADLPLFFPKTYEQEYLESSDSVGFGTCWDHYDMWI